LSNRILYYIINTIVNIYIIGFLVYLELYTLGESWFPHDVARSMEKPRALIHATRESRASCRNRQVPTSQFNVSNLWKRHGITYLCLRKSWPFCNFLIDFRSGIRFRIHADICTEAYASWYTRQLDTHRVTCAAVKNRSKFRNRIVRYECPFCCIKSKMELCVGLPGHDREKVTEYINQ